MTSSEAQRAATAEIHRQVELIFESLHRFPWASRQAYGQWLAQTYFYVRRVTHVLAAGASRTTIAQRDLHEHFLRGITEEKDHDQLAVRDLADLGLDIDTFSEHPLTCAFYQTLFYMIDRDGPESVLGYFFVLEGVAGDKGRALYDQVLSAYGGQAKAFLEEHVVADAEHFPRALEFLRTLDANQLRVVERSSQLAGALYRYLVAAIATESTSA